MANNNDENESRNRVKRPRRQYSAEEKRRLFDETVKPGESVSTVARRHNVAPKLALRRAQGDGGGRHELPRISKTASEDPRGKVMEMKSKSNRKKRPEAFKLEAVRLLEGRGERTSPKSVLLEEARRR